jgi:uncharacterized C2H2 Zn-finger protein
MTRVESMSMSGRAGLETGVCPRCGKPFREIEVMKVGGREYVYAYHGYAKSPRTGKWTKRRCYLGPVEEYELVTKLHKDFEGLILLGLAYPDGSRLVVRHRALQYIRELARHIRHSAWQLKNSIDRAELEETIRELEATVSELKRLLQA